MSGRLSLKLARRIALAAQGFGEPRAAGPVTSARMMRLLGRTRLLQIDSVNVLTRAHYMPLFSRLGPYPQDVLETAAWGAKARRRLFEYWAHEASLVPLDLQPLLRWRMQRAEAGHGTWGRMREFARSRRPEADALLKRIAVEGPMAASQLEAPKGPGGWWGWSDAKTALEYLFWSGRITTATRRGGFERVYDLTERVLPRSILALPTPTIEDAHRRLIRMSAQALGVATAGDLRDYFRLSPADFNPRLAELVEAGNLVPVAVEGWRQQAYLDPQARKPRRTEARALLAPFDPVVWRRERAERLFGFRYRIEIYTPAAQRVHGYYVLPFLLGESIAARVDLKADRAAGVLKVQSAHAEAHARDDLPEALAAELSAMAGWLGLPRVEVARQGDLAPRLAAALAAL